MIFAGKHVLEENTALRAENEKLRQMHFELIDKLIFNRQPERIVNRTVESEPIAEGQGDRLSILERKAEVVCLPKEAVAQRLADFGTVGV